MGYLFLMKIYRSDGCKSNTFMLVVVRIAYAIKTLMSRSHLKTLCTNIMSFIALRIDFSYLVGIVTVILSMTSLAAILIPSTVASTLKFRSGHFPTLRNPDFNKYRTQLEDLSFLIGIMFWGMLFSAALLFVLSAGTAFLLVWQVCGRYFIFT